MKLTPVAYLASYFLSLTGNSIAAIALPLIVLQTTGSALGAGAVAAATALPAIASGLVMGVVIDRINRRTSSVVTDLVSAASIAALPLIDLASGLNLGWFILCGVLGSLGDVPGVTARETLLPAIVRHSGIGAERLLGIRESLGALAILLGPAAAGTLMVLFDGSTVLWLTAATSLAAALTTLLIPHSVGALDPHTPPSGTGWGQLREGWRVLARNRFLVAMTAIGLASVSVLSAVQGLILPVYFTLVEQPGLLGFVLSSLALGLLIGGGVYAAAGSRGRRRVWFASGIGGMVIGFGVIGALPSPSAVFAGAFIVGLSSGLFGSLTGVLMIERVPERMRGRILGTQNALMTAAPPLGIVAAAVLAEYGSVNLAGGVMAAVWAVCALAALLAPSLRTLESRSDEPVEVRVP